MKEWVVTGVVVSALAVSCGGTESKTPAVPVAAGSASAPVAAAESPPPPREDGRLPDGAKPTGYALSLSLDPTKTAYSGKTLVSVTLARPSRFVVMHGRDLRIASAVATVLGRAVNGEVTFRKSAHGKGESDELVFTAAETLPAGPVVLSFAYEANFSTGLNGLYRVEKDGKAYAFTQFEPVGARLAFPSFDEPDAKVPFEVTVTVPKDITAVSNMPARSETPTADGSGKTIAFEKSPPLPTYLVALAVGPLSVIERQGDVVPLRLVAAAGRADSGALALKTAGEQLRVLEGYFGSKYPYPKLDLAAVPDFASGAMENAGLITFREERLLLDEKTAPTSLRRSQSAVIAHELSHMWFGDLVTMKWWDDIWLNEGFATWMATRVLDTWRPETRAKVEELGSTAGAMHADTLDSARRVRQPVRSTTEALEAFDGITYVKGAALLTMVERWLGPEVFRKGVLAYLDTHRFGNASGDDLFSALAAASGQDVPAVFRAFTEQTGLPMVSVDACSLVDGRATVRVSQHEYRPLGASVPPAEKLWKFPVCVHAGDGAQQSADVQACTLLRDAEGLVSLGTPACPRFIHPNADQSGYYRSKLPPGSLANLTTLPSGTLTARERVGVLSDAWALVESGELEASEFVELASRFQGDPEVAIWSVITSGIERIGDELVAEEGRASFEEKVRALLAPEAKTLGWDAKKTDGDPERVKRRLVLYTLGAVGKDPAVLRTAKAVAKKWLEASASVDAEKASLAVPLVAREGDAALFDVLARKLASDPPPAERVIVMNALAAFSDPGIIRNVLGLVLDGRIRAQDQVYVYRGLFGRRETRAAAFQAASERIDLVLEKMPPFARRGLVPVLGRSCSAEETARVRALIEPKMASLEGADRGFSQALEEGGRCAAFRARHAPKVAAWLASLAPGAPKKAPAAKAPVPKAALAK